VDICAHTDFVTMSPQMLPIIKNKASALSAMFMCITNSCKPSSCNDNISWGTTNFNANLTVIYCTLLSPLLLIFFFRYHGTTAPRGSRPSHYRGLMTTLRHTTVGRTPLDEWSAHHPDLYLTTHNRKTAMPPVGFEPAIPASERPQTHALDRTATGIGTNRATAK
jgi:hypothetical protein